MVSITLDERDEAVLSALGDGEADVESLAARASCRREYLRDRLPELADNGLVERTDDAYAITSDGRRAMAGSPAGTMDDRIDTPDAVEDAIRSLDRRPDRAEAVRNAFAFLRYWGEAHASEVIDAVYSENPAGFSSPGEWWDECVRDYLAGLPRVEAPESSDEPWRYAGTPTVDSVTDDGRLAADSEAPAAASVKSALHFSELSPPERSAVRVAFTFLFRNGDATAAEITDAVYPRHDAGYETPDAWWDECVRDGLERLPGVERVDEARNGWRYLQSAEGSASSSPDANDTDDRGDSRDGDDR